VIGLSRGGKQIIFKSFAETKEGGTRMKRANQDIRDYAAKKGVYFWEIAMKLSIPEPTMTRWMRVELPEDKRREIEWIIDDIAITKSQSE